MRRSECVLGDKLMAGDGSDEAVGLGTVAGDDCNPNVPWPVEMHRNRNKFNSHIVEISISSGRPIRSTVPAFFVIRYVRTT